MFWGLIPTFTRIKREELEALLPPPPGPPSILKKVKINIDKEVLKGQF